MSAYQIFTQPTQQALDTAANVLSGATLTFSLTGTNTATNAYSDSTLTTPVSNPLSADAAGAWIPVFLDPAIIYRIVLKTSAGVVLKTWDPANENWISALTQNFLGLIIYPRTAAEIAASITPTNYIYPMGYVDRYGTNTTPGTTDMTTAINAAFKVAKTSGHDVVFGPTWPYRVTSPIDCTQDANQDNYGYSVRNTGQTVAATTTAPFYPCVLADHTGHVFDMSGAAAIHWHDLTVGQAAGAANPLSVWFVARNSLGSSNSHRWYNTRARVSCTEDILYNYGGETCVYSGNLWYNTNGGANAKVVTLTAFNIRNLSSTFITIATGQQSMVDHEFIGGQYVNVSHHANADVFYLDAITALKILACWTACADGTAGGRSIIYADTTNGQSSNVVLIGVTGEFSSPTQNTYGIYCGNTAVTMSFWVILGCRFPNVTNIIKGAASVVFNGIRIENTNNGGVGGGADFLAVPTNSYIDSSVGTLTTPAVGATENNIDLFSKVIQRSGEARLTLRDTTGASNTKNWMLRGGGATLTFSAFTDTFGSNCNPLELGQAAGATVTKVGFHGTASIAKPTVTGAKGGNAALTSLCTALANYGLITDSTT